MLLPLDGMLVHRRVTPSSKLASTLVERGTVRVKCLAQEHNAMPWPSVRFSKVPTNVRAWKLFGRISWVSKSVSQSTRFSPDIFVHLFGICGRAVARAEIFQPVIGVKLTVDTAALSWFPHVRDVRIKIQNFVWWIIGKLIVSSGLLSSRNVYYSILIHLAGLLDAKGDWCKCLKRFLV